MDIAVVRGKDGKVLGITYDDGCMLDREDYPDWEEFLSAFARLAFSRVKVDETSANAVVAGERQPATCGTDETDSIVPASEFP